MTAAVTLATLGNSPAFSVYPSAGQSLTGGTFTKIQFNTEEFDTNNCFNTTNYRFTSTVAGYYQINLTVAVSTSVAIQSVIYKNGSIFQYGSYATAGSWSLSSVIVYLNGSTDYIEGYIYSSGTATTQSGANLQRMSGCLIRGA